MTQAFADTVYWLALLNRRDTYHDRALEISRRSDLRVITSTWTLCEVADACGSVTLRAVVEPFFASLARQSRIRIVPARQSQFDRGLRLFSERPDKEWSLTDCISFQLMRQFRLKDALTADHHFKQAGFRALLL